MYTTLYKTYTMHLRKRATAQLIKLLVTYSQATLHIFLRNTGNYRFTLRLRRPNTMTAASQNPTAYAVTIHTCGQILP